MKNEQIQAELEQLQKMFTYAGTCGCVECSPLVGDMETSLEQRAIGRCMTATIFACHLLRHGVDPSKIMIKRDGEDTPLLRETDIKGEFFWESNCPKPNEVIEAAMKAIFG